MISIIAAVTRSGAIGRGGDLVYHISADLRHFKELTMGHPVIMGRVTFESLPGGPLPGRRNIVISRRPGYAPAGAEVCASLAEAIEAAGEEDAYIIGGASVYAEALPIAGRLCLTEIAVDGPDDADTFFPTYDAAHWKLSQATEPAVDPRSGVGYSFKEYLRR